MRATGLVPASPSTSIYRISCFSSFTERISKHTFSADTSVEASLSEVHQPWSPPSRSARSGAMPSRNPKTASPWVIRPRGRPMPPPCKAARRVAVIIRTNLKTLQRPHESYFHARPHSSYFCSFQAQRIPNEIGMTIREKTRVL